MLTETPRDITAKIGDLPPMPRTAARVLEHIDDDSSGADKLGRIIETDPALAGSVLRLVNSALFSLPQHVTALPQAIVLLGYPRLRSLMLATVTAGLRDLVPSIAADARTRVWEHSIGTALAARQLADRLGCAAPEEAFVAGLMHDCGRLVLLLQRTVDYMLLLQRAPGHLPGTDSERALLGFDHSEVGAALLRHWNLAPEVIVAAEHHHRWGADAAGDGLLATVVLADGLLYGAIGDPTYQSAAASLGVPADALGELSVSILEEVAASRSSLLAL